MTDPANLEAVRRLKSSLSSIQIALKKNRAREDELIAKRVTLWVEAKKAGLATQSTLAKRSGVTDMVVSRAISEKED